MPQYFFNVEGYPGAPDREGTLLKGPEHARAAAVTAAGEILKDDGGAFWQHPAWRLHVTDEQGQTVCTLGIRGSLGEP